ncbi:hypothetical protein PV-S19_0080 [Pacmanvirus S19]|nr:hypothetical protein PV-S19_0080 [Pacmanvirus S19]
MDKIIQIKQSGNNRPIYTFEKQWLMPGGALYGDNFLSNICCETGNIQLNIEKKDNIYCISSIDSDPDYLFYLWKKAQNDRFDFYIFESEILFLYEFYRINGFEMMLSEIESACKKQNNSYFKMNCNLY